MTIHYETDLVQKYNKFKYGIKVDPTSTASTKCGFVLCRVPHKLHKRKADKVS